MIEVNNLTKKVIDEKLLIGLAKKVLKGENEERGDLSIAIIGEQRMKSINKKYRNKDESTDVLSFDIGEILICPTQVERNAKRYKTTFKKELTHVLIHGILHSLGYKHSKKMREKEELWQNSI